MSFGVKTRVYPLSSRTEARWGEGETVTEHSGGRGERTFDPLAVPVKLRVKPAAARHLGSLGIDSVGDALSYAPRKYFHWGKLSPLAALQEGEDTTVLARVVSAHVVKNRSGSGVRLLVNITDGSATLTCTFFARNEYALSRHRRMLQPGETFLFAGKVSSYQGTLQLVQPQFEEIEADSPESVERRRGRPIPIYRAKASVPSWKVSALLHQIMGTVNWDQLEDVIPKEMQAAHSLLPLSRAYQLLHAPEDDVDWQKARRTLAWTEALTLQTALLQPRLLADSLGKGRSKELRVVSEESSLTEALISALPFDLTGAQRAAWETIRAELAGNSPMQRLLQADVGAGKTVVALLAMLRAVEAGGQAVLLAPTEVLANQHFASLTKLLEPLGSPVPLHLLTGSQPVAAKNNTLQILSSGSPGIVVGTHALIQDGVDVPNLSLLVVDEQHRFGVSQREKLRENREDLPHLLVMTATPIPRTVAMTAFGDLDVTAMKELPAGRRPVDTFLVDESNRVWMDRLWERAQEEVNAGGRVYVVVPRISEDQESEGSRLPSVEAVAAQLREQPELQGTGVGVAHGQLPAEENAASLRNFASGETPILVSTTVVEVGVDVPEATMMVVLGAQRFGLSQLHQLRGRVGRSQRQSVCMLVHAGELSPVSAERLTVLADTTDGFELAEADLRLRQEGDVLGKDQSGGRSSLKFLSVQEDGGIIAAARAAAEKILAADPSLKNHGPLQAAVEHIRGEPVRWLTSN